MLKLTKPKPSINVNGPINGGEITLTNSNETSSKLAEKRTQADQSYVSRVLILVCHSREEIIKSGST